MTAVFIGALTVRTGAGLISREAFDAGAREPIPVATIHREGEP